MCAVVVLSQNKLNLTIKLNYYLKTKNLQSFFRGMTGHPLPKIQYFNGKIKFKKTYLLISFADK